MLDARNETPLIVYLVSDLNSTSFHLSHHPSIANPKITFPLEWEDVGPAVEQVVLPGQYWENVDETGASRLRIRKDTDGEDALANYDLDYGRMDSDVLVPHEVCLPNREWWQW